MKPRISLRYYIVFLSQVSSVQFSNSVVSNSATPGTAAGQASMSITNSQNWLKLKSIQSVMPFNYQFSSVQSHSHVPMDFTAPLTAACQASMSITNSQSLLKLMSMESVMPANHLILCHPHLLPPSVFPSIRMFSNESVLRIRWPKYWSFSFSNRPSNEYSGINFTLTDFEELNGF